MIEDDLRDDLGVAASYECACPEICSSCGSVPTSWSCNASSLPSAVLATKPPLRRELADRRGKLTPSFPLSRVVARSNTARRYESDGARPTVNGRRRCSDN